MSPRRPIFACARLERCKALPAAPWARTSACSRAYPWAAAGAAAVPSRPRALRSWAWPTADLAALVLKLGADVPVFVRGRVAGADGTGEHLTPLYPPLAP